MQHSPDARIFHDRVDVLRTVGAGFVIMRAFAHAPAVIATLGDEVNLLPQNLADVTDPQVAGFAVKAVAPRIAQAIGENFLARATFVVRFVHKRIVGRETVLQLMLLRAVTYGRACVDINPQHFGQQRGSSFGRLPEGIAAQAAVAQTEIKIARRGQNTIRRLCDSRTVAALRAQCARNPCPPCPGQSRTL